MNPKQVKTAAVQAATEGNLALALLVCETITKEDLYINVPKPAYLGAEGKETVCRWANRPCKRGCGRLIQPGTKVWWEPNWGISHIVCPT